MRPRVSSSLGRVVVVTWRYHIPRARIVFKQCFSSEPGAVIMRPAPRTAATPFRSRIGDYLQVPNSWRQRRLSFRATADLAAQQQCGDVDINSCDEGAWTGRMGRRLRETGLQEHPLMAAAAA